MKIRTAPKQRQRARVYVLGPLAAPKPTLPYNPNHPKSLRQHRVYRRGKVAAARQVARETLPGLGLVPGPLQLDRDGHGFLTAGEHDIYITTGRDQQR